LLEYTTFNYWREPIPSINLLDFNLLLWGPSHLSLPVIRTSLSSHSLYLNNHGVLSSFWPTQEEVLNLY
jgi:hypothetical protein